MKYYIRKEYPPGDTHCFGKDEPYQVIYNEIVNIVIHIVWVAIKHLQIK